MPLVTPTGTFILWLLKQAGKRYQYGAEVPLLIEDAGNPYAHADVAAWDCSELVQGGLWAAGIERVGTCPIGAYDPAWQQFDAAREIPLAAARETPGALVFVENAPSRPHDIGHVAVVIAKDTIVEARGKKYGVVVGPLRSAFTKAVKIDELYA